MTVRYGSLPFQQQLDFFLGKSPVPTQRWNDLQRDAHDTGFMVAGAMAADLLADIHAALAKTYAQGLTLNHFRNDFATIIAKHGWTTFTGSDSEDGVAWRTRVIYETNLRTAYQAGRWQQLQDGKAKRPYLIYKHSHAVLTPRAEHLAWDGVIVPVDSDWVKTHYPPNGFGCQCTMFALSERDLTRLGKPLAPHISAWTDPATGKHYSLNPPDDGTYDWKDPKTGDWYTFPKGIQPFWDYAPGASLASRMRTQVERKIERLPKPMGEQLASLVQVALQPKTLDDFIKAGAKKTDDILQKVGDNRDEFRAELLRQLERDVGISTPAQASQLGSRRSALTQVLKASMWLPNRWTQAIDAFGTLWVKESSKRAFQLTLRGDRTGLIQDLRRLGLGLQPGAINIGYIVTSPKQTATALHELTHRVQAALPELDQLFQSLHKRRTHGMPLKRLKDIYPKVLYDASELTREDHYIDAYFGKEYADESALEVMTMSLEAVLADDHDYFTRLLNHDRELFDLTVGVLFHYAP